ncbi:MAG: hypothetical protein CMJ15_11830 [Pelagibacterium sp.]|uniref:hypothetical protein n=1 Tax=uncultured Pelagibacterium sp. TaxID=1159875 RepID=UPI000C696432|nr:hypothetical protein [Pelagibacterium sp.]|tara:strand:+ start:533 stop:1972 length:1440 start_codon:yes stop_codon:yes gene_type:complete
MKLIQSLKMLLAADAAGSAPIPISENARIGRENPQPAKADSPVAAVFERDLENLVENLGTAERPLVTGSMELLGLDEVRACLGAKWNRLADQALAIATAEIKRYLSDQDFFKPESETRFLICFASLNREQAMHKASLIARAIRARLLDELPEIEEQTSVERFVTEVDPKDLAGRGRGLADRLAATLERIQGELEVAVAVQRRTTIKDFQLLFAPIWEVSTHVTTFNRCQADTASVSGALARMRTIADNDQVQKMRGELDCMILARGVERLHGSLRSDASVSLLVPLTFSTFLDPDTARDYLKILASVPAIYRNRIVLELRGIGNGVTISDILSLRDRVSGTTDRIVAEITEDSALLPIFEPGDIFGISFDLSTLGSGGTCSSQRLRKIVQMADQASLASYAHSANTLGVASAAIRAGFQFIDGPAVHLNVTEPRPATRLKPMVDMSEAAPRDRAARDSVSNTQTGAKRQAPTARPGVLR